MKIMYRISGRLKIDIKSLVGSIIFLLIAFSASAQHPPLNERAKGLDANNNGLVDRGEAMGPLQANFDEMDCDKNGGLDGAEIPAFFQGTGCPKKPQAALKPKYPPLNERAEGLDANNNGLVDRAEARGPLEANFDEMDCDKNGGLDGAEIPAFFSGAGCPKTTAANQPEAKAVPKAAPSRRGGSPQRPPQAVKLDEVRLETTAETYSVIGRITALQTGPLSARISGAVETVSVEVGDRVTKGEVIATLSKGRLRAERQRISAQVTRHRTMVSNAERELKRMKGLSRSAAFSRARFEDQEGLVAERKAQLAEFNATLNRLQIDIKDATIRAPYDAVVLEKHVVEGGYANVGSRVVTLLNDKSAEVEAEIPSFRVIGLKLGARASIVTEGGKRYPALVRAIIPSDNTRTRSRPIRLISEFGKDTSRLANNQSVTVVLSLTNGNKILTVHKDAIIKRANGNIVFVVKGMNATMRNVKLGRGVGNKFQVLEGLKAGDKVVVRGNERLGAGGRIKMAE